MANVTFKRHVHSHAAVRRIFFFNASYKFNSLFTKHLVKSVLIISRILLMEIRILLKRCTEKSFAKQTSASLFLSAATNLRRSETSAAYTYSSASANY